MTENNKTCNASEKLLLTVSASLRKLCVAALLLCMSAMTFQQLHAQEKILNPEISYASSVRMMKIGALNVSGVEGYESYMLTSISGLSVGQEISVPGNEITEAVKKYWRHGLFSDVKIAADSIVGDRDRKSVV